MKAGCDLECGNDYNNLVEAVNAGAVTVKQIDTALERVLTGRFRLGMFDPPDRVPYAAIPASANDTAEHDQLALQSARSALVLLKNRGNLLPLDRAKIRRLAVVGPNADSAKMLLGNYYGTPSHPVKILDGIRAAAGPGWKSPSREAARWRPSRARGMRRRRRSSSKHSNWRAGPTLWCSSVGWTRAWKASR